MPLLFSLLQYRFSIFLYRDALTFHYPVKKILIEQIQQGHVPYWNPAASFGQPLLSNPNAEPFYPDNLLYLLLPFDAAWNFHFWFHWIFGIVGIYGFIRTAEQFSHRTAVIAAMWWGGSGYLLSAFSFYNLLAVVSWLPWVALCFYNTYTSKKLLLAIPLGVAVGLQFLAGEPVTCFATWMLLVFLAFHCSSRRAPLFVIRLLVSCLVGALIVAPQMIALLEIYSATSRSMVAHSFITASNASLEPFRFFEWLIPYCWGPPFTKAPALFAGFRFTNFPFLIHSIHLSFLLLIFCLMSFKRPRIAAALGMIVFAVLAVGRYLPAWKLLYDWAPFWSNIHFPIKFFAPLLFLMVLCGSAGFEQWINASDKNYGRKLLNAFVALWFVVGIVYFLWLRPAVGFYWLQIALAAATLATVYLVFTRWRSLVVVVALLECVLGARYLSVAVQTKTLHVPVYRQVEAARTFFSPEIFPTNHKFSSIDQLYDAQTKAGMPLWGAPFGIRYAFDPSIDGLYSYYNDYFGSYTSHLAVPLKFRLLARLGVEQFVTKSQLEFPDWKRAEFPGFYLYKTETPKSIFFPITKIESKASIERTLTGLTSGEGPFARWQTKQSIYEMPESFRYESITPSNFRFHLKNKQPAFVLGRTSYFSAWRVTAELNDGQSVRIPVNQVDLNFVGFELPAGTNAASFYYESRASKQLILCWMILLTPLCVAFLATNYNVSGGTGRRGFKSQ